MGVEGILKINAIMLKTWTSEDIGWAKITYIVSILSQDLYKIIPTFQCYEE